MIVFLSLCSASLLPEPLRVLWCFSGLAKKPFPTFFLANYASQKEEFARNALQNDGSGATAHICTDKNRCGDGRESQTGENTET